MYFTPTELSTYVLDRIEGFGADFRTHSFLDPAAGGASFLGPIAQRQLERGCSAEMAASRLHGIEIDPALAQFARAAASLVLGAKADRCVVAADTLKYDPKQTFDCVVGNPPYRVLTPHQRSKIPKESKPILGTYANLYGLFIMRSLQLLHDGGLMALLVPTSFVTGNYYGRLREHVSGVAEVLAIDNIGRRKEIFRDVSHDVCLFVCRKRVPARTYNAEIGLLGDGLSRTKLGVCQISPRTSKPWNIRSPIIERGRTATLKDYGYTVSCGPIVHNRDEGLISGQRRKRKGSVPLVWGHAIKHGRPVNPASHRSLSGCGPITFASTDRNTRPISKPSIVLQRTTSADQTRRIRAGFVDRAWLKRYGGFYGENHVVVVSPSPDTTPKINLKSLWMLLESAAVDRRLRRLLSSNSVNVTALRELALPELSALRSALRDIKGGADIETAIEAAYVHGA